MVCPSQSKTQKTRQGTAGKLAKARRATGYFAEGRNLDERNHTVAWPQPLWPGHGLCGTASVACPLAQPLWPGHKASLGFAQRQGVRAAGAGRYIGSLKPLVSTHTHTRPRSLSHAVGGKAYINSASGGTGWQEVHLGAFWTLWAPFGSIWARSERGASSAPPWAPTEPGTPLVWGFLRPIGANRL